jgi:selenocysteine lyase/cysteine desulfurase
MQALAPQQDFIGVEDSTYLYTGAESAPLKSQSQALERYLHERSHGEAGRAAHIETERQCKTRLADVMGCGADDIGLVGSASEAIVLIASGIDFKPGDNIVTNDLEFPSTVLPWIQMKEHGIEVRLVRNRDWQFTPEEVIEQIDGRTRLVAISHVSYLSGLRLDLDPIAAAAHAHGALLLADVTQSLGVVPVDVSTFDFAVASTYKWLLGIHGGGVLYWNRARLPDFAPGAVGWFSVSDFLSDDRFERITWKPTAERFELGMPSYAAIYALENGVRYLQQFGTDRIGAHVEELGSELIEGLQDQGWPVMTPVERARRAGNISIAVEDAVTVRDALIEKNIHTWGGDGRVRSSIHLYNDSADVAAYLGGLEPLAPGG